MSEFTRIVDLHSDDTFLIDQLSYLVYEAFLEHAPGWLESVQSAKEEVAESFQPERLSRILVDSDGEPLGWIGVIPQMDGRVWEIHPLVVAVSRHGKGFGRKLVEDVEQLAKQNGVLTLWAGTSDQSNATTLSGVDLYENPAAAISTIGTLKRHPYEFWKKVGFTIVGVLPDAEGIGKPSIFLAKRVSR